MQDARVALRKGSNAAIYTDTIDHAHIVRDPGGRGQPRNRRTEMGREVSDTWRMEAGCQRPQGRYGPGASPTTLARVSHTPKQHVCV